MRILPMGPTAVLVEELPAPPASVATALAERRLPGVVDIVPAASTVLVTVERSGALEAVVAALEGGIDAAGSEGGGAVVEIPVVYDGDDLDDVAALTGLTVDAVIRLHAGASYRVAFCGFAPGFAYLEGVPTELHLPRRATPRTRVPAGSVAIAATYSAVYPTSSPGGWHLLGRTDTVLFDVDIDPPALLRPGVGARFVAT